jgi:diguanylate cyclase (GGDEF)-like protein
MVFVRWLAIPWVFLQLFAYRGPWPAGLREIGIAVALVLTIGNTALWLIGRRVRKPKGARALALAGLSLDVLITSAFVWLFAFDEVSALWAVLFVLPLEGAIRFQLRGALATWAAVTVLYVGREIWGSGRYGYPLEWESITFRMGIGLFIALVAGLMARDLFRVIRGMREHEGLQRVNDELAMTVGELERRTEEVTLINEMGDLLQICGTLEEACDVIGRMAQRLFPSEAGALYLFAASRTALETGVTWGLPAPTNAVIAPKDCWALRRGGPHVVESAHDGPRCPHVEDDHAPYLCLPMAAQGETLGFLHLQVNRHHTDDRGVGSIRELATAVAEHLALALANFRLRDTLRNLSVRDPLTGLFNRRYLEESLEREVRRAVRHRLPLGLIVIDVDHFKRFNDAHGHGAGDDLLQDISRFLQGSVRGEDIVCRYGGEEFVIVLPEATLAAAEARAEQLRHGVEQLSVVPRGQPTKWPVTISLGVSAFPDHGSRPGTLVRAADAALYRAKALGRNCVVPADPSPLDDLTGTPPRMVRLDEPSPADQH